MTSSRSSRLLRAVVAVLSLLLATMALQGPAFSAPPDGKIGRAHV